MKTSDWCTPPAAMTTGFLRKLADPSSLRGLRRRGERERWRENREEEKDKDKGVLLRSVETIP